MGRALFLILLLALAVFYYYLLGAGPTPSEIGELAWWRPRGWALRWESLSALAALTEEEGPLRYLPVALFALPPLLMMALGVRLLRSAVMRVLVLGIGTALAAFSYYGLLAPGIWRFFSWRWPALLLCMSVTIWALLLAPSLIRGALRLPMAGRVAALLLAVAAIYLPSVEVTGTNFELPLNISPWPVITVFGFLLFGYVIAGLHVSVGLGAFLRSAMSGPISVAAGILLSAVLGAVSTVVIFSEPTLGKAVVLGLAAAIGSGIVLLSTPRAEEAGSRGRLHLGAAALLVLVIFLSNESATRDQMRNRDRVAPEILGALTAYYEANEIYPDDLEDLAPDLLAEIPRPTIGLWPHEGERFLYTNLGDSFVLEFACAKWVQCAYSPPYLAAYGGNDPNAADPNAAGAPGPDVAARDAGQGLEGAWSCDPRPPKLW